MSDDSCCLTYDKERRARAVLAPPAVVPNALNPTAWCLRVALAMPEGGIPVPVSQNGWPANNAALVASQQVPGTRTHVTVRKDAAGQLLLEVASAFDRLVQDIEAGIMDDWGYASRPIRGGTALSNHASGTAIDLNATKHPLGTAPSATFTAAQIAQIHKIVAVTGNVVRWGGDYTGRKDCLTGDTLIVTADGPRPIRDLADQTIEILSTTGDPREVPVASEWVKAPFESFGDAPVFEVTLKRRNTTHVVRCTGNHRWPVQTIYGIEFVDTADLTGKERVPALTYPIVETNLDPMAVAQGIVWGDGSVYNRHGGRTPQAAVGLCDGKVELRPWLEPHARYWTEDPHGPRANGLPAAFKSLPAADAPLDVKAGFFAGWFACDGCVHRQGVQLSSSDVGAVAWLRENAPSLGLTITSIPVQPAGKSGFSSTKDNFQINLREVPDHLLIRAKHRDAHPPRDRCWFKWTVESVRETGEVEEVFCPTVEGRHVVALATDSAPLLTGQSMHFEINDGQNLASCAKALAAMRQFNSGQSAPTGGVTELSAEFEAAAKARWPKEDKLDVDTRGDLHNKQVQLDRIEAAVAVLTKKVAALSVQKQA